MSPNDFSSKGSLLIKPMWISWVLFKINMQVKSLTKSQSSMLVIGLFSLASYFLIPLRTFEARTIKYGTQVFTARNIFGTKTLGRGRLWMCLMKAANRCCKVDCKLLTLLDSFQLSRVRMLQGRLQVANVIGRILAKQSKNAPTLKNLCQGSSNPFLPIAHLLFDNAGIIYKLNTKWNIILSNDQ